MSFFLFCQNNVSLTKLKLRSTDNCISAAYKYYLVNQLQHYWRIQGSSISQSVIVLIRKYLKTQIYINYRKKARAWLAIYNYWGIFSDADCFISLINK